jgi:hypothetical protein
MMKQLVTAAAVVILAATTALSQTTEKKMPANSMPAKGGASDALMQKERALLDSVEKKDWTTFRKLVKPGTWAIDENGPMANDEFLKTVSDPKSTFSVTMTVSDMKVLDVNANSKIVMYKLDQKGSFMGQPVPPVVYASTVWVNQGGTWQAVFHQESTAAQQTKK